MKFGVTHKEWALRDDFTYIPAHIQHSDPKVADSHAKLNDNFSKPNLKTSIYVLKCTSRRVQKNLREVKSKTKALQHFKVAQS